MAAKRGCSFEDLDYLDGAEVCRADRCLRCEDGEWVDTGSDCPCG